VKRVAVIGIGLALLGLPGASRADSASRASWFTVTLEAVNGSGCRTPATVKAGRTRDGSGLVVTYRTFKARGGSSRNCQLMVRVRTAKGRTYAIGTIASRGRADFGPEASGRHTFTSYFSGEDHTRASRHDFEGPRNGPWRTVDSPGRGKTRWAPCDRDSLLNINNVLRVTGPASGHMNLTSTVFRLRSAVCR
jgi:hypothetical protein